MPELAMEYVSPYLGKNGSADRRPPLRAKGKLGVAMTTKDSHLKQIMMEPGCTVRQAMAVMITPPGTPMILVVDPEQALLGVVVDFDIRTALLNGKTMDSPIGEVMNPDPMWLPISTDPEMLRRFFHRRPCNAVPLLDDRHRVRGLARLAEYLAEPKQLSNQVLIMAGGLGQRLRPLTEHRPKPMVEVGNKPILETILTRLTGEGFRDFLISVCYKADQIKEYFGDGSRWGSTISYLEEPKPLGTAGALSLIQGQVTDPLIVVNGDLLTKVNFRTLLSFHETCGHQATICVREHTVEVPYGVVEVKGTLMDDLVEKPVYRMLVNAGIYVLEPEVLNLVRPNQRMDMTELLNLLREAPDRPVGCFPVSEYWLDVGRPVDHQQAQNEYTEVFESMAG